MANPTPNPLPPALKEPVTATNSDNKLSNSFLHPVRLSSSCERFMLVDTSPRRRTKFQFTDCAEESRKKGGGTNDLLGRLRPGPRRPRNSNPCETCGHGPQIYPMQNVMRYLIPKAETVNKDVINVEFETQILGTGLFKKSVRNKTRQEVVAVAKEWPSFLNATMFLAEIMNLPEFDLQLILPPQLLPKANETIDFLERLNDKLTFGEDYSLMDSSFTLRTKFKPFQGAPRDLPEDDKADALTDVTLASVLEFSEQSSQFDQRPAGNLSNNAQLMQELRARVNDYTIQFNLPGMPVTFPRQIEDFQKIAVVCKKILHVQKENTGFRLTIRGQAYALFRENSWLENRLTKIGIFRSMYQYKLDNVLLQNSEGGQRYADRKTRAMFTIQCHLVSRGCASVKTATSALLKSWNDPGSNVMIKIAINRFKWLRKRHLASIRQPENDKTLMCLGSDLLVLNDPNSKIVAYMSEQVRHYVVQQNFDCMFTDGTYLKHIPKGQLLIVRLYSSYSHQVMNILYAFCEKRDTTAYVKVLNLLREQGLLENIRVVMTDFELALSAAFKLEIPNVERRFCLFHLVNATKRYSGRINKAIELNKLPCPNVTPRLQLIVCYLFLQGHSNMRTFFAVCKIIYSLIPLHEADSIFLAYYVDTYLCRNEVFIGDIDKYPFLTNNTLEGTNSGLKKFLFGRKSDTESREWIVQNVKRTITDVDDTVNFTVGKDIKNIKDKFDKKEDWYTAIIDKAFQVLPKSIKRHGHFNEIRMLFKSVTDVCILPTMVKYKYNGIQKERAIPAEINPRNFEPSMLISAEFPSVLCPDTIRTISKYVKNR